MLRSTTGRLGGGRLTIPAAVVLLLDSNATLYASLNPANYQVSGLSATCGTVSANSGGCHPFITVDGADTGIEAVRTSSGTQVRIDGRGDLVDVRQRQRPELLVPRLPGALGGSPRRAARRAAAYVP